MAVFSQGNAAYYKKKEFGTSQNKSRETLR